MFIGRILFHLSCIVAKKRDFFTFIAMKSAHRTEIYPGVTILIAARSGSREALYTNFG